MPERRFAIQLAPQLRALLAEAEAQGGADPT